ncbi:hypothetical protein GS597_19240 [Synechococcales cyanobacterium C]|uniref:Uncharacterized protein n=1 Tax=Petrachloros mirabilis ULC683 TaxID=2781853 RepID=A0A8K2A9V9_9CYAN|nr:hypothetical protein [Petrachloros mirabilis]NCJ08605.1 hypothetical protein [Petrachloros mirabilis ULC683]
MSNRNAQEAYEKGQRDGSQGSGYSNPAHDIANELVRSGSETQEVSKAYSDGYKNGQANKA